MVYYVASIALSILLILLNANKKKAIYLLSAVLFVLLALFLCQTDYHYIDLINYYWSYNNTTTILPTGVVDVGFYSIVGVLKIAFGFSFENVKCFCLLVSLLLLFWFAIKVDVNPGFFALFYSLYYIFLDGEQLRNFLAFAIIINALLFLCRGGKRDIFFFVVMLLIATTIHLMSSLFFVLLLIRVKRKTLKKMWFFVVPLLVLSVVVFKFSDFAYNFKQLFNSFFSQDTSIKIDNYLESKTRYGFLFPFTIYTLLSILVLRIRTVYESDLANCQVVSSPNVHSRRTNWFACLSSKIDAIVLIGFILLPLCVFSLPFYRYVRNLSVVLLCYLGGVFFLDRKSKTKAKTFFGTALIVLMFLIWEFGFYTDWEQFRLCYFG